MAELKFDMQRLAADVMEKVLDETEYKGRTLRDWIDGIASGEYVQAEKGETAHWDINCDGYYPFCSNCKESAVKMLKYCPNCGAKMITRE